MLTLLSEVRFWTSRSDIIIKENDIGAYRYHIHIVFIYLYDVFIYNVLIFRYHTKSTNPLKIPLSQQLHSNQLNSSIVQEGKISYSERRGLKLQLDNKRPFKLKNTLKQLEEELKGNRIVFCQWKDSFILQCMVSTGLLIHICVNIFTGDIIRIAYDKYFVGKLISENVTNGLMIISGFFSRNFNFRYIFSRNYTNAHHNILQ